MSDDIFIKQDQVIGQQPYIARVPKNAQEPVIRQTQQPNIRITQIPSTYQNRTPTTYQDPRSAQEPNIRSAQEPNIRDSRQPFTYQHRSPLTYDHRSPFTYDHRSPTTYNHRSPSIYRDPRTYQNPSTYDHRSPATYRNPVAYRNPFTYQHRSPSTYNNREPHTYDHRSPFTYDYGSPFTYDHRSPFTYQAQQPVTYQHPSPYEANVQTPVIYSYRSPYIFNMWGTPGSLTTNTGSMFNQDVENLNANDVECATTLNTNHNNTLNTISFKFIMTKAGGSGTATTTTNTAQVGYTGTLSSLQARFVFSGVNIALDDDGGAGHAVIAQAFGNGAIDASDISGSNPLSVSGATTVNDLSSNEGSNVSFSSAWGTLGLTDATDFRAMLYLATEPGNSIDASSYASLSGGSGDSIAIQLRGNGDNNDIVTLYTKTGTFSADAYSYEDDTT